MCGLDWHQFFLTNKNRNTITRATNSPWVSLEFHVPFENPLSAGIWPFVCKEYLSCLCRAKAVFVEYKYKHFSFFQLACTSRLFVLPSFLHFFPFWNKTATGRKKFSSLAASKTSSQGKRNSQRYSTQNTKYGVEIFHRWLDSPSTSVLLFPRAS